MRRLAVLAGFLAAGIVSGALLVAWSGVYNIAASSGHWPGISWFLHFAMENSVRTWSPAQEPLDLSDPALVVRGAGHFEAGCAPCHGAPGEPRGPIVRRMMPEPPHIASAVEGWTPEELFWIVLHGVKMTGMPAWAAERRDDEVWSVVAFLLAVPGMEGATYRRLAFGPVADEADPARLAELGGPDTEVLRDCARCHGLDGEGSPTGAFPRLGLQDEAYLYASLHAYAQGLRPSGIMRPMAEGLTEDRMRALARHYAGRADAGRPAGQAFDPDLVARGRIIAETGLPEAGVPACRSCHGPGGERRPLFPNLAGQYAPYIEIQLRLFREGIRGGSAASHIMEAAAGERNEEHEVVLGIPDEAIRAVAAYYASLPAGADALAAAAPLPAGPAAP